MCTLTLPTMFEKAFAEQLLIVDLMQEQTLKQIKIKYCNMDVLPFAQDNWAIVLSRIATAVKTGASLYVIRSCCYTC